MERKRAASEPNSADYESGLLIDEHALDEALASQPDSFYRVSKHLALLISRRDAAKTSLTEAESEADARIRARAMAKEEKVTEAEVNSRKRLDADVQSAQDDLHKLNREVGEWGALKDAFVQRSHSLSKLVDLYTSNYYADAVSSGSQSRRRDAEGERALGAVKAARKKHTGL